MQSAIDNQQKIASIRNRMLNGTLSYEQAKAEAQPIINDINATAAQLARKYRLPARKVSFAELMR